MGENAVSLKLPTFWSKQPKIWFAQAESQFTIRKIVASDTKYHYVVAALDQETAARIPDRLQQIPDGDDPYKQIKDRLLGVYDMSDYERASALLHLSPLRDQKPSELMDKMLGLLGEHKPDFLFRQLFLEQLPSQVRSVLVHSKVTDCKDLAKAADSLQESTQHLPTSGDINKVSTKKPKRTDKTTSDKSDNAPRMCFYHKKWGNNAHRCLQPCTWQGNSPAGPQ